MIERYAHFFADFAIAATVDGVACHGIFNAPYRDNFGVAGNSPELIVAAEDLPDVATGQSVSLPTGDYTVRAIEPEGTGLLKLILEAA